MASRQSKPKLKIAFIFMPINEIRPPVSANSIASAGDLVIDETARRLARSHEVIAYCARGKDQPKVERLDGVEYRRMATSLDRWVLSHHRKIMRMIALTGWQNSPQPIFNSALWYRQFIGQVTADPALADCDIVHVMNISQFLPFVRARVPTARIVLQMHCKWLEEFDAAVTERRLNVADLVLGTSDFIATGVRRRFPSLAQRCGYVYNGTDLALFARPAHARPTPKRLLYVGRLAPEKGIHVLLDAFRLVLAQHPDAHLELIGPERVFPLEALFPACDDPHVLELEPYFRPGVYAELLRGKISELPSGAISYFNQGARYGELAPHYHRASIFVFPSVCEESFGMPLVEAMASGTPVVATRGGAFPEILDNGRCGLLVERSDVCGLAGALLRLLSAPDQREAMAQAGLERAATKFSWDRVAADLVANYKKVLR